jgi:predicted RNase H-like nuclease (RuvC/YqgF family)
MGRAFVNILRYLLILALIAGVVAAIYFGTPYLYEKFIQPIEENTARLDEVENKQAADIEQLTDQIADLKSRLADLETRQTTSAQTLAEVEGQITALESAVEAHDETLEQLETIQAALDSLALESSDHESSFEEVNLALADVQRQVALSRAIEMLSRARLYLYESNFGLARLDVEAARDLLLSVQSEIPADKEPTLGEVITRLDMALDNLPDFPVIAADDLNIAWQLLVNDLPDLPTPTATPESVTETPTPTEEVTPTVTP